MGNPLQDIREAYFSVKLRCKGDCGSAASGEAIRNLARLCLRFLARGCRPVTLTSAVPGKEYTAFARRGSKTPVSRPANKALFVAEADFVSDHWGLWQTERFDPKTCARLLYTAAIAPCLAMELFDRQNKKGPATYFECLIGHLFASSIGVNPVKRARVPIGRKSVRLTMDFLFDLPNGPNLHLPVKMSTRERVVQAWAHQRILDAAFGEGAYKGIMVLFAETKLDSRSHEVVEICVPDQWLAYQARLARMDRIYYLDVPRRYAVLASQNKGVIVIKPFTDFFTEKASLLRV